MPPLEREHFASCLLSLLKCFHKTHNLGDRVGTQIVKVYHGIFSPQIYHSDAGSFPHYHPFRCSKAFTYDSDTIELFSKGGYK